MRETLGTAPGWGGLSRPASRLLAPGCAAELEAWLGRGEASVGLRGLGRSYGDACTADALLCLAGLKESFSLDAERGLLRASAGWSLGEALARTLPRGWVPAVLPGTRHVTLGGAVAADVHGKNHHVDGAFCHHVERLRVMLPDGSAVTCGRDERPELFRACCGGMGLAGVVLEVSLRLARRQGDRFRRRTLACADLDAALDVLRSTPATHTVAWVDAAAHGSALGRALVHLGDPAEARAGAALRLHRPARLALPLRPPFGLVRPWLMRAFNEAVWRSGLKRGEREDLQHYEGLFWPLDAVGAWNRLYGRPGFLQFQCLLPEALLAARGGAPFLELLRLFRKAGGGALAVMKTMGPRDPDTAPIAFPGLGATLAVDLPATPAARLAVKAANRMTADWGGRVYLAKDALLGAAEFRAMTPELLEWRALRDAWDPGRRWMTDLSKRLEL